MRPSEEACKLTQQKDVGFLDARSAAYAEVERFAEAIKTAEEARALAEAGKDQQGLKATAQKLELYRAGKLFR